jgi:hypothetical protein
MLANVLHTIRERLNVAGGLLLFEGAIFIPFGIYRINKGWKIRTARE